MRPLALVFAMAVTLAAPNVPRTMRVDYVHTGNSAAEQFALDEIVLEGDWPGRLDRAVDDTNLGKYYFEVLDRRSNRVLFSRGFASIFGEWETTDEAKEIARAFHESLRFPAPDAPVQVVVKKRDKQNAFREVWSMVVDPAAQSIDRTAPSQSNRVWAVMKNGDPQDKVDLLLLGDGYTAREMDKWHKDARRLTDTLFSVSPFKERRSAFNVWAIDSPSEESGVARPSDAVYRRSPVRAPTMHSGQNGMS